MVILYFMLLFPSLAKNPGSVNCIFRDGNCDGNCGMQGLELRQGPLKIRHLSMKKVSTSPIYPILTADFEKGETILDYDFSGGHTLHGLKDLFVGLEQNFQKLLIALHDHSVYFMIRNAA